MMIVKNDDLKWSASVIKQKKERIIYFSISFFCANVKLKTEVQEKNKIIGY